MVSKPYLFHINLILSVTLFKLIYRL